METSCCSVTVTPKHSSAGASIDPDVVITVKSDSFVLGDVIIVNAEVINDKMFIQLDASKVQLDRRTMLNLKSSCNCLNV